MPLYFPFPLAIICAFVLGSFFGSFANVLAHRLPIGKSIIKPPSFCPACEKRIKIYDLVPVLSYFLLKGKCRLCKAKISPRYPIVEFSCGALFAATSFIYSLPAAVSFYMLAFALLVVTLIDMQVQEIPDSMLVLVVAAAGLWILLDSNSIHVTAALIGAVAGAVPLFLLDRITLLALKKDGFGYGDVKLMGATGLFLGWQGILAAYFIAFVTGAIAALYMLKTKKAELGGYIAFGPFLCAGTIISAWSYALLGTHLLYLLF